MYLDTLLSCMETKNYNQCGGNLNAIFAMYTSDLIPTTSIDERSFHCLSNKKSLLESTLTVEDQEPNNKSTRIKRNNYDIAEARFFNFLYSFFFFWPKSEAALDNRRNIFFKIFILFFFFLISRKE